MLLGGYRVNEVDILNMFDSLAKRVIKSLAKNYSADGISDTAQTIILSNWKDSIFEDIRSEITLAVIENINSFSVASNIYTKSLLIVSIGDITYSTKTGKVKTVNAYAYLCKVVRDYLDRNTNKAVELIIDSDREDDEPTNIVNMLSNRIEKRAYNLYAYPEFLHYVSQHVKPDLYSEIAIYCEQLSNGRKINEIASIMNIKETRAYWLRKKIAELYSSFNPIERKTIEFCSVSVSESETAYKRVESVKAVSETLGKKSAITVCKSPVYTELVTKADSESKRVNIVSVKHGGDIVTPKENTRVKRYVVNMTKECCQHVDGINNGPTEKGASGSYTFKYGMLVPYTQPVNEYHGVSTVRDCRFIPESDKMPVVNAIDLVLVHKEEVQESMKFNPSPLVYKMPERIHKSYWSAENVRKRYLKAHPTK